jgi:hypothetical protein
LTIDLFDVFEHFLNNPFPYVFFGAVTPLTVWLVIRLTGPKPTPVYRKGVNGLLDVLGKEELWRLHSDLTGIHADAGSSRRINICTLGKVEATNIQMHTYDQRGFQREVVPLAEGWSFAEIHAVREKAEVLCAKLTEIRKASREKQNDTALQDALRFLEGGKKEGS